VVNTDSDVCDKNILLRGQVAVITGASRGIGRSIAKKLAAYGIRLVLVARSFVDLKNLADEIKTTWGDESLVVQADISTVAGVEEVKTRVFSHFAHVDILINNAGVGKYAPFLSCTIEDYEWMMNTNMRGSFLCTQAFLPDMIHRKQGWIIFIGSVSGLKGKSYEVVYCATKFAQAGFAQALDYEVRRKGIKVTLIAPGSVRSNFAMGHGRSQKDMKRCDILNPEDVADAVCFALQQPPHARVFCIDMRSMVETL